jgi:hypothetical protein
MTTETKKRVPGVPNDALLKAADIAGVMTGTIALVTWEEIYGNKVTTLTIDGHSLTAGNNTLLVMELIRFWVEAQCESQD